MADRPSAAIAEKGHAPRLESSDAHAPRRSDSLIAAPGEPPKQIEEFIGRVNSQTDAVSIARMPSPPAGSSRAQTPVFDEYTVVLQGFVAGDDHEAMSSMCAAGQAVITPAGEWVQLLHAGPKGPST